MSACGLARKLKNRPEARPSHGVAVCSSHCTPSVLERHTELVMVSCRLIMPPSRYRLSELSNIRPARSRPGAYSVAPCTVAWLRHVKPPSLDILTATSSTHAQQAPHGRSRNQIRAAAATKQPSSPSSEPSHPIPSHPNAALCRRPDQTWLLANPPLLTSLPPMRHMLPEWSMPVAGRESGVKEVVEWPPPANTPAAVRPAIRYHVAPKSGLAHTEQSKQHSAAQQAERRKPDCTASPSFKPLCYAARPLRGLRAGWLAGWLD